MQKVLLKEEILGERIIEEQFQRESQNLYMARPMLRAMIIMYHGDLYLRQ
jgi:hypothetical protein